MIIRVLLLCLPLLAGGQTIADCKRRFDTYINFKGSLTGHVRFGEKNFHLYSGGRRIISVYEEELVVLAKLFKYSALPRHQQIIGWKTTSRLSKKTLDSLDATIGDGKSVIEQADSLPLRGYRVAIDPGHFAANLTDARVEPKYLHFVRPGKSDTIVLFESILTFQTAVILKKLLEEQGAAVMLTRSREDFTSLERTYTDVYNHREMLLDSLLKIKQLKPAVYKAALYTSPAGFYARFFRDFELANRANRINRFDPHATAIIHYNVDEKNIPWNKETKKNFTMAFIGGAMTGNDITTEESRAHLLRLLITDQLDQSEQLAAETVRAFSTNLGLPVARPKDATYLYQKSLPAPSPGVYSRNLVLCRKVNSPLVYGEALYQDNEAECANLMRCNVEIYGMLTSERVTKVAASYFEAIFSFLKN